ncbi:MAG: TolC family protein [Prolixibacteraceae bacterium]|nr:TolC family protein [Prolixibacteraceae bacterium]
MNQNILKILKLTKAFRRISFLLIWMVFSNFIYAQEVYNLEQCIQKGLENNFSLKVARNKTNIASNNHTLGNAGMLPTVTSANRYGGTVNNTSQIFDDGTSSVRNGIYSSTASVAINMGLTIFRGFQVQRTYEKLGELSEIELLKTQMEVENLVAQIVVEYNYYIEQLILYQNLAYAVSLSRERLRIDEQRYNLGGASRVEYLQSMVYLNSDSSRYARQKEVLRTSQIRLNELMANQNLGQDIVLADSLIKIDDKLTYEYLLSSTLDLNTSLQIASKNQVITGLDLKIIESRAYPYLSANAGYGYNYYGYMQSSSYNQHSHGLNYGLTLGIDIFDGFNRKREKSNALIEVENRKIEYQEVEQAIMADLLSIFYAYQNNLNLLRLEEQNLGVARENLEIALERYKLGSLAGLELREVQKSLLDAEERLISVKFQTKLAEISLKQISGKVMDYM